MSIASDHHEKMTLKEAIASKQPVYFDSDYVCKEGHCFWRYTRGGYCWQCKRARDIERARKKLPVAGYRHKIDDIQFERKTEKELSEYDLEKQVSDCEKGRYD